MIGNLFKKIRPEADAKKNASNARLNAFNNTKSNTITVDVKNVLDKPINRVKSGLENPVATAENAFIILGKGREDTILSGPYPLSGVLVNSIDISVGLGYTPEQEVKDAIKSGKSINPSFIYDKARVYITEAAVVDSAFGIEKYGTKDNNEKLLSAVVTKADTVRIISRSNIKLITGKILDNDNSLSNTPIGGVELIAASAQTSENSDGLQPMVLGNNLQITLNDIIEHLNNLNDLFSDYLLHQMQWDSIIAQHMHLNVFPNTPDPGITGNIVPKLIKNTETMTKNEIDKTINSAVTKAKMKPISNASFLSSYHKLN